MPAEPYRIVLVEDNEADVYLFRRALQDAGLNFELTVIEDGAEALAYIRDFGQGAPPDAAIIDLNLPKSEGTTVLEAIRKNTRLSAVPVVIVTSSASPAERAKAERLGAERFVTKPPDLDEFLRIGGLISDLLSKARAKEAP